MNLEEFKKALSSDATEENKQLKKNSCRNFKKNTAPLKKVVRFCAIDALLLQKG